MQPRQGQPGVGNEDAPNHQTGRPSSLDLRFDVAMRGALGIGSALNVLPADEREVYRRKIAFYKKIRPVVQGGDLYQLDVAASSGRSIWQSVLPDASRAVYSVVVLGQLQGAHFAAEPLRGLAADARYAVSDEHGREPGRYPGWQLMSPGMPGDRRDGGMGCADRSRTVLLERVG